MVFGREAASFSFAAGSGFTNIRRPSKFSTREICAEVLPAANPRVARMTAAGMAERLPIPFRSTVARGENPCHRGLGGRRQRIRGSLDQSAADRLIFLKPGRGLVTHPRSRFWRSSETITKARVRRELPAGRYLGQLCLRRHLRPNRAFRLLSRRQV